MGFKNKTGAAGALLSIETVSIVSAFPKYNQSKCKNGNQSGKQKWFCSSMLGKLLAEES